MAGQRKNSFGERLLDLLFPIKCPFCHQILEEFTPHCPFCQDKLPWRPTGLEASYHPKTHLTCFAPLWYLDGVVDGFHRYKFSGVRGYSACFGRLMEEALPSAWCVDVISWVPLSKKRLRKRGYDQAKLLAEVVAEARGFSLAPLLTKVRDNQEQSSLEEESARWENTKDVYCFSGESIQGKRILLVDDIFTTGATLSSCANVLKEQGAEEVFCLCLAWARK